jgi:hypothetical protein
MSDLPVALTENGTKESIRDVVSAIRSKYRGLVKELWIQPEGDSVVLYGRAYSYYGKQMAQEEVIRSGRLAVVANRMSVIG